MKWSMKTAEQIEALRATIAAMTDEDLCEVIAIKLGYNMLRDPFKAQVTPVKWYWSMQAAKQWRLAYPASMPLSNVIPDYARDMDAIYAVLSGVTARAWLKYEWHLEHVVYRKRQTPAATLKAMRLATARQHCEAYLLFKLLSDARCRSIQELTKSLQK